ncbi:MBL fold metallo-hydrolase [Rhizobium sp. CRIBSB]|nr:MBL fold metallo-hydrolase [Rhizobium sp. CRIBSB]
MFLGRRNPKSSFLAEEVTASRRQFLKAMCACCAVLATDLPSAFATTSEMQAHLDAAKQAAGSDLVTYLRLGDQAAPISGLPPVSPQELMALPTPEPGKVFDNLYFVGNSWVSCWAITTSDGIILIDAMDNDDEAKTIIVAGLQKVGLDPATIKMVVVTHGHGDHYGGANYLKNLYGCSVVMGEPDWKMLETALEMDVPDWGRPPVRDVSVEDGSVLTLGDTKIDILATPGHTPGTITLVFDVKDGGTTHRAMLWGGTAFNFARRDDRIERLQTYIDATERVRTLAKEQAVSVFISNHDLYDGAVAKLAQMKTGGDNPFVVGNETTLRALTVMNECAKATMIAWKA